MLTLDPVSPRRLPHASVSRLTHARLRRPTELPNLHASSVMGRCLNRLRSLLGGR